LFLICWQTTVLVAARAGAVAALRHAGFLYLQRYEKKQDKGREIYKIGLLAPKKATPPHTSAAFVPGPWAWRHSEDA